MYEADLRNSGVLEQCPYKTRNKKIEWLLDYFEALKDDDDCPCYEPLDILVILKWLNLGNFDLEETKRRIYDPNYRG